MGFCLNKNSNTHYVSPCEEYRCSHFVQCVGTTPFETPCPRGTVHNPNKQLKVCDYPRNVPSCNIGQTDVQGTAPNVPNTPSEPPTQNADINPFPGTNQYPTVNQQFRPFNFNQWLGIYYPDYPGLVPRVPNNNMRF